MIGPCEETGPCEATGLNEVAVIETYLRPLVSLAGAFGLRDDCAELRPAPGQSLIIKTDPVRAGVHFFAEDEPGDIAWKALAVNVSDLAAKAARPLAYTLALSFPEAPSAPWLERFAKGLAEAQEAFGLSLIGGDTDQAPGPMSLAVTVFGELPVGRMVPRAGANADDLLYVSGTVGEAAVGLRVRQLELAREADEDLTRWADRLKGADPIAVTEARDRYLRPLPVIALKAALRRCAHAAMDLSDGLAKDLDRMCRASGVGCDVDASRLPHTALLDQLGLSPEQRWMLSAEHGDDYEILAAVPPAKADLFEALATAGGVRVTQVGQCNSSGICKRTGLGDQIALGTGGYDHFAR